MIGGGATVLYSFTGGLYLYNYILRHVLQWITIARTFAVTNESSRPEGCRLKENISCYCWIIQCMQTQIFTLMIIEAQRKSNLTIIFECAITFVGWRVMLGCHPVSPSHPSPLAGSQFPVIAQFRLVMQKDNRHSDNWQLITGDSGDISNVSIITGANIPNASCLSVWNIFNYWEIVSLWEFPIGHPGLPPSPAPNNRSLSLIITLICVFPINGRSLINTRSWLWISLLSSNLLFVT